MISHKSKPKKQAIIPENSEKYRVQFRKRIVTGYIIGNYLYGDDGKKYVNPFNHPDLVLCVGKIKAA